MLTQISADEGRRVLVRFSDGTAEELPMQTDIQECINQLAWKSGNPLTLAYYAAVKHCCRNCIGSKCRTITFACSARHKHDQQFLSGLSLAEEGRGHSTHAWDILAFQTKLGC